MKRMTSRLDQQIEFVLEIDKLKTILRQTTLCDASRRENSAEHSWHLAVMANLLTEYAEQPVDVSRVTRMLLVHDIVEIDAGDTFAYDTSGYVDKAAREREAAERIFGLLPTEQGRELRVLWEEFESAETAEAKYANALDRLQPLLHNNRTGGGSWHKAGVTREKVLKRMEPVRLYLPKIWPTVQKIVDDACECGWIKVTEH